MKHLLRYWILVAVFLLPSLVLAQTDGGVIVYGDTVNGTITDEAPQIAYTFEGSVADVITIEMAAIGPDLDSYLTLLNSTGEQLAYNDDSGGSLNSFIGPFVLPEDGTYTIVAASCCGDVGSSRGAFELSLNKVDVPVLPLGDTITSNVNPDSPTAFAFIEPVDDMSLIRVDSMRIEGDAPFVVEVSDQTGMIYYGRSVDQTGAMVIVEPVVLNSGSTLLLSIRALPSGPPSLESGVSPLGTATIETTVVPVEPQSFADQPTDDAVLSDETPVRYYSFEAEAGSLFTLEAVQTPDSTGFAEFIIYGPQGFSVNGGTTAYSDQPNVLTIDPIITDFPGMYTIIARRIDPEGSGISGTRVVYSLTFAESNIETFTGSVTVTGTVGGAQSYEQLYRYDGVAGQALTITLTNLDENYGPAIDIQTPADPMFNAPGMLANTYFSQPGSVTLDVTLPVDGIYLIRVTNGKYSDSGPIIGAYELAITSN